MTYDSFLAAEVDRHNALQGDDEVLDAVDAFNRTNGAGYVADIEWERAGGFIVRIEGGTDTATKGWTEEFYNDLDAFRDYESKINEQMEVAA